MIILNTFIKRWDRHRHSKSDLVGEKFSQLEFFYNADMTAYYTYFDTYPSDWDMTFMTEYLILRKETAGEISE